MIRILSGFPGVGKSTLAKNNPGIIDLDSALFPKDETFVESYMKKIMEYLDNPKIKGVMVSTHPQLLEALYEGDLNVMLVAPDASLKDEYMARYEGRGDWEAFLKQLDENWYNYLQDVANAKLYWESKGLSKRVILKRWENLSDVVKWDNEEGFALK